MVVVVGGGTSSSSSSSSFLLPLKALFAILVSASLKRESTGGGRGGGEWGAREGVCDNEKRRTTSVFARCSFCDPHLALRHGGRNREEGIYQERGGTREGRWGESKRVCAWGGMEIQHTHMRRKREREAGRGKKPLDSAILSQR